LINFFYNKPILRLIELLLLICLFATGYLYLSASFSKLGIQGLLDAIAIYSFVVAGFLFILVAEVADSYYFRAFASLLTLVGMFVAFYFIFKLDAPHLPVAEMSIALICFIFAIAFALAYLILVVGRLILEKIRTTLVAKIVEAEQTTAPEAQPAKASPPGVVKEAVEAPESAEVPPSIPVGAPKPLLFKLICVSGPHAGAEFELAEGENLVGRAEGTILLSADPQVSRRHALLIRSQTKLVLRDLGSTNGSWVNGIRTEEAELKSGDRLQFGQCVFELS